MNLRFVVRGLLAALVLVVGLVGGWYILSQSRNKAPAVVPPPPVILMPRGELPIGPGGLIEFAQYGDSGFAGVGCGFLLQLPAGRVIGVTTAHSVLFSSDLQQIAFGIASQSGYVAIFNTLWGNPGVPRSGEDMSIDYVLLKPIDGSPIDPALILQPDPRGAPQPGERVALFSGLGDGSGKQKIYEGTVDSVSDQAVLVLMDGSFDPSGMSGSPFLSEYTGRVIGMTIATTYRGDRVMLALHPISSIVLKAQSAAQFPKIGDYRR